MVTPGAPRSRASSASTQHSGYTFSHFSPKPRKAKGDIDIFAHAGPSKELVQAKFQRQRLEKNASKLSRQLDIFRPKSADYGSGVSSLGIGVRRASDIPFRSHENDAHTDYNLKFGELWDPFAPFAAEPRPHSVASSSNMDDCRPKSRAQMPMSMSMGLGQLWRPDSRTQAQREKSQPKLILRSTEVEMDRETKRMIVYLLEKCRLRSTALFKSMKASDPPDPATGKCLGRIPGSQFELCIRSSASSAPKAVFNVLLEMIGMDEDGTVDYIKFFEDLDIEEVQMMEQIVQRKTKLKAQKENEMQWRRQIMQQEMERQQVVRAQKEAPPAPKPILKTDERLFIEVDSLNPELRKSGVKARSWFKPRHLTSAYGHDIETMYCVPGGPLGVEMQDAQRQPPIECKILEHELHHMRDHVLREKVAMQRQSRNNSGNDDAFYG